MHIHVHVRHLHFLALQICNSLTCEGVTDVVTSDDNEVGVAASREEVGVAIAPEPARAFSPACWRGITTGRVVEICHSVCVCGGGRVSVSARVVELQICRTNAN